MVLSEGALHIECFTGFKDVVAGSGQFVRHRLESNHRHRSGGFLLIPAFDLRVVADREVGGLDKGPGQILVATLGIAFAFLLTIGITARLHGAGIRGKLSGTLETGDVAGLQRNGQC